jgi:hypothetical protein
MPNSNTNKPGSEKDWFDKLPKKTRIVLLMLFTGAVSAYYFLDGVHLFRTGEYSNYAGHKFSWWGDFFWCAFWLVITGLLCAAYLGWFKDSKGDPPK